MATSITIGAALIEFDDIVVRRGDGESKEEARKRFDRAWADLWPCLEAGIREVFAVHDLGLRDVVIRVWDKPRLKK